VSSGIQRLEFEMELQLAFDFARVAIASRDDTQPMAQSIEK